MCPGVAASSEAPMSDRRPPQAVVSDPPPSADERRAAPRVRFERPVHVSRASDDNFYAGILQDISTGGVFVATAEPLPVGLRLQFELAIDEDPPVPLVGEVRWARTAEVVGEGEVGVGLAFIGLPPAVRARIERFVQRERETLLVDLTPMGG